MIVWIEYTATHLLGTFFNDYQQKKSSPHHCLNTPKFQYLLVLKAVCASVMCN